MTHDRVFLDFLEDILHEAERILAFTRAMDEAAFVSDPRTVYAVTRALEVMGEAAKRVPGEVRARHPHVPWGEMAAMRDKLIHGYFGVDERVIWQTVHTRVPSLRDAMIRVVGEERQRAGEKG